MKCRAIVARAANKWAFDEVDTADIAGVDVKVMYSSLCGTDLAVLSGELIYYKKDVARYPIVTGHEWCGIYQGQPVVGLCVLGCEVCDKCVDNNPIHCNSRMEVGVLNKNGAHSEYVTMPESALISVEKLAPEYALVEPLAVCVHAIEKLSIDRTTKILISGYGCIGKLCGQLLDVYGYQYDVFDSRIGRYVKSWDYDIVLECSGLSDALDISLKIKGVCVLMFGLDYRNVDFSQLVHNEVSIIGTLGATLEDFRQAAEMVSCLQCSFYKVLPWTSFSKGLGCFTSGHKVIFEH